MKSRPGFSGKLHENSSSQPPRWLNCGRDNGSVSDRDRHEAEDAAVPGLIGLTQIGKADPEEQDEDHEGADVKTEPSWHGP